jgi:hypothetical protein
MSKVYDEAKKVLEREIEDITRKGSITMDDVVLMEKLLDNLKDISIICAMEEEGYSERMMYDADASYARGRGAYARRDSMGRYASRGSYDDGYGYENNGSYNYRGSYENGYSGHEDLDRMMSEAKTEKERELIRQLKEIKR